jgi:hypothetical protein
MSRIIIVIKENHNLYALSNTTKIIKSRGIITTIQVVNMKQMKYFSQENLKEEFIW